VALWNLALLVNVVIAVAYLAISIVIARGIHAGGQWRSNPLAVATALIFLTCAIGHAAHAEHLLLPSTAEAARTVYDSHLTLIDVVTAVVGVRYWMLRGQLPELTRGAAVFADLTERRRQALDLQDHVVQQLVTAKLALEMDHREDAAEALERGIGASRDLVSQLLGDPARVPYELRLGAARRANELGR
jgi:signal transduction histidine kinase